MYWMSRPPYLRWVLGAIVAVTGVAIELAPETTVPHPFAIEAVEAGAPIGQSSVDWKDVPVGLFEPVTLPLVAARRIEPGEPILASAGAEQAPGVPAGWWAMELAVPEGAAPGRSVQVVVAPADLDEALRLVEGSIVSLTPGDGFEPAAALVAVPAEAAALVAVGAGEGRVTVLLGP